MISGGHGYTIVAAGAPFCGLTGDSLVYCWNNQWAPPSPVSTTLRFKSVAVGYGHGCAVTVAGAAYCWGFGSRGQLGNGDSVDAATAVPVSGNLTFQAITAGDDHTCALTPTGAAYCWGGNYRGQLGIGTHDPAAHVVPQDVAAGLTFSSISAGEFSTCGLTIAGTAYCWGWNGEAQVGNGSLDQADAPSLVAGQQ
jgi:alpha-tubulin suppressor-like RCC1 family protein